MEAVNKEKIKLWKENNKGTENYYKVIELEEKYFNYDEGIAIAWIFFTILSLLTLLLAMPILFVFAIIVTIYNLNIMNKLMEEMLSYI